MSLSDEERAAGDRAVRAGNDFAAALAETIYTSISRDGGMDPKLRLLWCAGFLAHVFGGFAVILGPGAARYLFRDIANKPTPMDDA